MKHTVTLLVALLLAPLAAVHAAEDGTKPEALRLLARLPSINVNVTMGFQSTDFEVHKTNAAPRKSEAELREVLKASPTNAAAWCELGEQLLERAMHDHLHVARLHGDDIPKLLAALQAGRLTRDDVQHAWQLMEEALDCFSKAIANAPEQLDGYLKRLGCQLFFRNCLQAVRAVLGGDQPNLSQFLTTEALSDFQQVARLCPDNVNIQSTLLFFLIMSDGAAKQPGTHFEPAFLAQARTAREETRARLETLAAGSDSKLAAQACEGLGMNRLMFGATDDAQTYCRRAITLDPARDSAWELLAAVQIKAERNAELLAVCTERVRAADTSRNRYFLAKAHEQLAQFDQTIEQLDLILKREPDHFLATLGKAAMLLRRGDEAKAAGCLQRAAALANDKTDPGQTADLLVLQAIQALLRGDRKTADLHLGHALKLDGENRNARAVLRALGS